MSKSLRMAMILIGIFYLVMFSAIGITLNLAFSNHQDVMDSRYYDKGLDYQSLVEKRKKAREAGLSLNGLPSSDKLYPVGRAVPLRVTVNGMTGTIENAKAKLVMDKRAGGSRQPDIEMKVKDNALVGDVLFPEAGYWELYVYVDLGDSGELVESRILSAGR